MRFGWLAVIAFALSWWWTPPAATPWLFLAVGVLLVGTLFSPIAQWELIRLTRRHPLHKWRTWFLAGLGSIFVLVSILVPPTTSRDQLSAQAIWLAYLLFGVQYTVIVVITPYWVGSVLSAYRDRQTLDELFTTELTAAEIILSTLATRVLMVSGVMLLGLPVVFLLSFWGGITPDTIIWYSLIIVATLLSIASLSVLCSALATTTAHAITTSFVAMLLLLVGPILLPADGVGLLCPYNMYWHMHQLYRANVYWEIAETQVLMAAIYWHLAVVFLCIPLATIALRPIGLLSLIGWGRRVPDWEHDDTDADRRERDAPIGRGRYSRWWNHVVIGLTVLVCYSYWGTGFSWRVIINVSCGPFVSILGSLLIISAGMRACDILARAIEQRRLDELLITQLSDQEIIRTLWWQFLRQDAGLYGWFLLAVGLQYTTNSWAGFHLLLTIAAVGVLHGWAVLLGLLCSVREPNALLARVRWLGVFVFCHVGTLLACGLPVVLASPVGILACLANITVWLADPSVAVFAFDYGSMWSILCWCGLGAYFAFANEWEEKLPGDFYKRVRPVMPASPYAQASVPVPATPVVKAPPDLFLG